LTYDDETIRALRATIDEDKSGGGRAQQALEALGAIRDDRAIRHIHEVAAHSRGKLKKRATQILGDVCRQRGLSQDELQDRVVPTLGLDDSGTTVLDYGARKFTVGFDELLRPFVRDATGMRLAGLPHAAHGDDAEKAAGAAEKWKTLKADVHAIGGDQAHRLERAMCDERHWTASAFATFLVRHPLLGHLARRLVYSNNGKAFRIAEDGSYADENDVAITLDEKSRVTIVHPATLDEAVRTKWAQILADYQVMQPFPQMSREIITLAPEEMSRTVSKRWEGTRVKGGAFFGLRGRGWEMAYVPGKRIDKNTYATLNVQPGIFSLMKTPEDQTVGTLVVAGKTFSAMPPVARAEMLRDVDLLCRSVVVTTS
jgi:hypothetical protein